ncbi:hypothetical protein Ae717Ps2_6415 [Pseudonocardia sp. Ae717_Ps2]|uniref:hypothetical protein n=1 Tax=Pseudonocardia sp. Ae717_Ps2 TaxID=1885573 RepID=UPI00094B27A7|nr:hypothetical protein [Pseudonocardia sp. Ae717_Ps2]OLM28519.1 hypothetical protein Ae717Ps2_6415 [Pseudonocardia sp. Ae717_Ps2]
MTGSWFARWSAGLVRAGMPAPTLEHGLDVQRVDLGSAGLSETSGAWARYLCKGLASEAVMGSTKAARGTSRSIYELMHDATVGRRMENPDTGQVVQLGRPARPPPAPRVRGADPRTPSAHLVPA